MAGRIGNDQPRGPVEFLLGQRERGVRLLERGNAGMQRSYLVFDILHGLLQLPAPASRLCLSAAHRGAGCLEIRLCGVDGRLLYSDRINKRLLVQLNKKISLVHAVVVIHQNSGNLTVDAGSDECHVTVHESIIRRNRVES